MSERLGQRYLNLRERAEQAQMALERATSLAREHQEDFDGFTQHLGTLVTEASPKVVLATDDNDEQVVVVTWDGKTRHREDTEGAQRDKPPVIEIIKPRCEEEKEE